MSDLDSSFTPSIYDSCSLLHDSEDSLDELLQCISNGNQALANESVASLQSGVDTFYLIFAGALVYFM